MFKINSYLQFKNTSNGKPKLLVEGVDYQAKTEKYLKFWDEYEYITLASLSYCRPLLSVGNWREGDICTYNQEIFTKEGGSFNPANFVEKHGFVVFDDYQMNFELNNKMFHLSNAKNKQGSFFDDPKKYSQLLWDCTEEEGWEKVLKLLDITL